ncbi:MAG: hypothetical protein LBK99_21105 [Opitutaceae bacterium]|jgi:hypothetical protein|nr:hypothetical protein [Opitutaceae bacterium]
MITDKTIRRPLLATLLAALLTLATASLHGETAYYFGPSSGATGWTTTGNWYTDTDQSTSFGGIPGANDDIIIMGDASRILEVRDATTGPISSGNITFGPHTTGYHSLLIGTGTLTVGGGTGTVANNAGSSSFIVINGAAVLNASAVNAGDLELRSGGSLTIGAGQIYTATSSVTLGRGGSGATDTETGAITSVSTLTIDGGTLKTYSIANYDNNSKALGVINFNSGVLNLTHSSYTAASINGRTIGGVDYTTTIKLGDSGPASTRTLTISRKTTVGPLASFADADGVHGSLKKDGTAELVLQSAQTFTGEFEIAAGKVTLDTNGSLAASVINLSASAASLDINAKTTGWTLAATQTLAGTGTINGKTGNTNITVLGTLAAGSNVKFDLGTGTVDLSSAKFGYDAVKGAATFTLTGSTTASFAANGDTPALTFNQLTLSDLATLPVGDETTPVTIFTSPVAINTFDLTGVVGTHDYLESGTTYTLSITAGTDNKSLQMQILSTAAVPEPAATAATLGALATFAALALRHHRRQHKTQPAAHR